MAYRRSLRFLLINRKFQLRFSFYVCSWLFVLGWIYPSMINEVFEFLFRYMAIDPTGPELSRLQSTRQEIVSFVALIQVVILVLTFVLSLFLSHRIAGPLYKLDLFFKAAQRGELRDDLKFRKYDHFQDLAASFNQMMSAIRQKIRRDDDRIAEALQSLEQIAPRLDPAMRQELERAMAPLRPKS